VVQKWIDTSNKHDLAAHMALVDAGGRRTRMASFFRVQKGLIVEWLDAPVDQGGSAAANQNSAACQAVNTALGPG
jgi:hypothetical protein